MIWIAGDLVEQHPTLLWLIFTYIAASLIPESWFLRPLLLLFGFGPLGPIKGARNMSQGCSAAVDCFQSGSAAAWAQRFFWGAAVEKGSWFAYLQQAGMKAFL
jgi:hypothetical protein